MKAYLIFLLPLSMIAAGVHLFFRYKPALAKKHKDFEEQHGISRGLSVGFRLFLARFIAVAAIVVGLALLLYLVRLR